MQPAIPPCARGYGFVTEPTSTHTSRTLMLAELSLLFSASDPATSYDELRRLVVEENVCLKRTEAGRKETFRRLRELYALRQETVLYSALRLLWDAAPPEQPLMAMLCANARDTLLRVTAPVVLEQPEGGPVNSEMLSEALQTAFPGRYSPIIRAGFGRHALSSWFQSGHLAGKTARVRRRAVAGPASTAYALLLGHLCGARGLFLFETFWAHVLDLSPGAMDSMAFAASQRGWLNYRRISEVVEITFPMECEERRSSWPA